MEISAGPWALRLGKRLYFTLLLLVTLAVSATVLEIFTAKVSSFIVYCVLCMHVCVCVYGLLPDSNKDLI